MKKKVLIGAVLVLTFSLTAAAWDVLAHAYIMEQIKGGPQNANGNEVYGVTSPDFVNYLIGTPYFDWLYSQTHTNFMRVWHMAGNGKKADAEQSLAMGFVAHNGLWGADYTAHVSALPPGDPAKGYVIDRAMMLENQLGGSGLWASLGIDGEAYAPLRLELCHNIIEYVVDIQVWIRDPAIGSRVMAAAGGRDASMPQLVKTAYAGLLVAQSQKLNAALSQPAAWAMLQSYEFAFQTRVVLYGGLFATAADVPGVVKNLSVYLSALAGQVFGLTIPDGQVEEILFYVLLQSGLTDDAMDELGATADFVRDQLVAHNIVYGSSGLTKTSPPAKTSKMPMGH